MFVNRFKYHRFRNLAINFEESKPISKSTIQSPKLREPIANTITFSDSESSFDYYDSDDYSGENVPCPNPL